MTRQAVIPSGSWPRGLRLDNAADYLGMGRTKFLELVDDGRLPRAIAVDGVRVWDRYDLDDAFEQFKSAANAPPNSFDAVLGMKR
jgi:predicted DNA-binding transcriptional regulator AlpA